MASMVPYRSVFGVRPSASSLFDLFDDMTDLANNSIASKAFPVDVEDKGDGYEVKAYRPASPRTISMSSLTRAVCPLA